MPWGYRRSAKIGPVRVNLSKSGIGYSIGGKALRYGKTAKGRSYVSSSPLPGVRYRQTLAPLQMPPALPTTLPVPLSHAPQRMSQRRLALTIVGVVGGLALLFVLIGAITNGNTPATLAPRPATITVSATVVPTPIPMPTVRVAAVSSQIPTATAIPKATIAPTPVAQSVTITAASSVNLRSGPDTDAEVLAHLDPGTDATVIDADVPSDTDDTHWVHVAYADQNGYIRNDLVGAPHVLAAQSPLAPTALVPTPTAIATPNTPIPPTSAPTVIALTSRVMPPGTQVVRGLDNDPVNIRESPSSQSPVIALLNPNTDAVIVGTDTTDAQGQRWLLVQLGSDGKNGYVRADVVSVPEALKGTSSVSPPATATNAAMPTMTPTAAVVYSAPPTGSSGGCVSDCTVYVHGYYRKNGTYVQPYYRSPPGTRSHK